MYIDDSKDGGRLTSTLLEVCTLISWSSEMDRHCLLFGLCFCLAFVVDTWMRVIDTVKSDVSHVLHDGE